jgi:serine/threonine-protein kinase RsbT
MPYWDERFAAAAKRHAGVKTSQFHIDILAAQLVQHPDWFDVIVGSNLFGNTFDYGVGGVMLIEQVIDAMKIGLRLTFEDKGPGIDDVEQAIKDGYTTGGGMGLGLGGARRLANEFYIDTKPGEGTRVTIIRWK